MRVIGFNFTKMNVERLKESKEKLKVNTNIDIPEISEVKTDVIKTENKILSANFIYNVNYDPSVARVNLEGRVLVSGEAEVIDKVIEEWKSKKISPDFKLFLFNIVLKKSTLKALQLEEELNLPLHMPMPSFKKEEKSK